MGVELLASSLPIPPPAFIIIIIINNFLFLYIYICVWAEHLMEPPSGVLSR